MSFLGAHFPMDRQRGPRHAMGERRVGPTLFPSESNVGGPTENAFVAFAAAGNSPGVSWPLPTAPSCHRPIRFFFFYMIIVIG